MKDDKECLLLQLPKWETYYLLIQKGSPISIFYDNPIEDPSDLKDKRLLKISDSKVQELKYKKMIMSWIDVD